MPFETPSLPVLIKRTQSDLASDALRQSDAQVLARALGGAAYGLYGYLDWIADQILPDKADESTLERIAALRLNQPRKAAQAASGSVSFSAAAGAVLDVDTLLQASDGRTYKVTAARTTSAGNNSTTIRALDAGTLGNAEARVWVSAVKAMVPIRVCEIIDKAIQLHGATGVSQWTPLADMYTSQRTLRLADGPDEVHWFVVGRSEIARWEEEGGNTYDPKAEYLSRTSDAKDGIFSGP